MSIPIIFVIGVIIICFQVAAIYNKPFPPTGHWQHNFDNCNYSTKQFYALIETFVGEKSIPGVKTELVSYHEGGAFSKRRDYLRVQRDRLIFDICAAPFAKGFFVSSWQTRLPTAREVFLTLIPYFGKTWLRNERAQTYFELDTEAMFKESIHLCVLKAVDDFAKEQGIRLLAPNEKQGATTELV
jgi:hypothetical protein